MKTTLVLDDAVVRQLKAYARRRRVSASRAAQDLIRAALVQERTTPDELPPLPAFHCGEFLASVDSRAALYEVMDDGDVRR
jgi:hypothetical protein